MNAYHWCERHMAWTMHSPKECRLGKERKEEKALSATVAAAAATAVNPSYQALLSALLTADAQARLLTYCKDYLIEGIECAPLMYKVIMRLAMIDSVATTQAL